MSRRRVMLLGVLAATPVLAALAVVRPADAASDSRFGNFGLTAVAGGVRTAGDVGVSGGLITLDTGSAFVQGSLDAGPSSKVTAAAIEPGTLVRTLVGTVNTTAGSSVLTIQDAEAAYPGHGSASYTMAGPRSVGPLTAGVGSGTAKADPAHATGSARGADLSIPGLLKVAGSFSSLDLSGSNATGRYLATATSGVADVDVAGVLQIHGVAAVTKIEASGSKTVPTAKLTIGSATVAGIPVSIEDDGVHVLGHDANAALLAGLQDTVNAAIAAAGLEVHAIDVIHSVDGRSSIADSGGVLVSIKTPDLPAGLTGNSFTLAFGKVTLTGISSEPYPTVVPPLDDVIPPVIGEPIEGQAPTTDTDTPVVSTDTQPLPPALGGGRQLVVYGHRISARTALGVLGCWQLLSLAGMTGYALLDRRRRLRALGSA